MRYILFILILIISEITFAQGGKLIRIKVNKGETGATGPAGTNGIDGDDGREVELQNSGTFIQWRYVGDVSWTNLIDIDDITGPTGADGIDGADGTEIELQNSGTYIQWRYVGAGSWTNLIAISAITGADGSDGADGVDGSTWYDGTGAPSGGLGIDGDYYLNDANGDVYVKASGSWSITANIKGADGLGAGDLTGITVSAPVTGTSLTGPIPNIAVDTSSSVSLATAYDLTLKENKLTGSAGQTFRLSATNTVVSSGVLINDGTNIGIGSAAPSQRLHVNGNFRLDGGLYDAYNNAGTLGQILSNLGGTGTEWVTPKAYLDTLNGLFAATQTFATGTTGTDFNISSATSTHTFNIPSSSASNRGLLTSTDWTTFNGKESALTFNAPLSRSVNTIAIPAATTSISGHLTSADWNTFNNKENALTFTSPLSRTGNTISIPAASSGANGYLSSTDWSTFNGKIGGSGTSTHIPYFTGTTTLGSSANHTWDNANNTVQINGNIIQKFPNSSYTNVNIGTNMPVTVTGQYNFASGFETLKALTTGANNFGSGYRNLYSTTTGNYNFASGTLNLYTNTTGSYNFASGYYNLNTSSGHTNFASGNQNMATNSGNYNFAAGEANLNTNTGNYNFASGGYNLYNTTGSYNFATGVTNMFAASSGSYNFASGFDNMRSCTSCSYNFVSGYQNMRSITSGQMNFGAGYQNLYAITTGSYNLALPYQAGFQTTTGENNIFLGYYSGYSNVTGSKNVFLGFNSGFSETGSSKLYITNTSGTTTGLFGDFVATRFGINQSPASLARTFDVNGEVRIRDLTTDTPTSWVGSDGDGDLANGSVGNGIALASGALGLTGQALAVHNLGTNGLISRTSSGNVSARTITAGNGIAVTNGDGVSGNPTIVAESSQYGQLFGNGQYSISETGTYTLFSSYSDASDDGSGSFTTNTGTGRITCNFTGTVKVSLTGYFINDTNDNGGTNLGLFKNASTATFYSIIQCQNVTANTSYGQGFNGFILNVTSGDYFDTRYTNTITNQTVNQSLFLVQRIN